MDGSIYAAIRNMYLRFVYDMKLISTQDGDGNMIMC